MTNQSHSSDTKKCSKCGEAKGLDAFHKRNDAKDGRRGVCKTCDYARLLAGSRKYAEEHSSRKRESFKAWYWRNRESQLALVDKYQSENAEMLQEKRLAAYHDDPETFRKRSSDWAKANRESKNAYEREYVKRVRAVRKARDAASARATHKGIAELSDSYVKATFVAAGIATNRADVPLELIALKREQLVIKRLARELKKAIKPKGEPK